MTDTPSTPDLGWRLDRRLVAAWQRLSVVSLDARRQIGVSVALITVIPMLAFTYEMLALSHSISGFSPIDVIVIAAGGTSALLGYMMMCAYPRNIARLRAHLEDLIEGRLCGNVQLLQGMADVPAIERAMQTIVHEYQHKVEKVEDEVARVGRLLNARLVGHAAGKGPPRPWTYVNADAGGQGIVRRSFGADALGGLLTDVLDLVECAGAVYERDGNLALGIAASGWAQVLCGADAPLFRRAGEDLQGLSLRDAAVLCVARADQLETQTDTGDWAFLVPLRARGQVSGVVCFTCGGRPADAETRQVVAARYGVSIDALTGTSAAPQLPEFVLTLAKYRLVSLARLVGESIERQLAEEELRAHHDNLEAAVQARTAELEKTNAQLEAEIKERRRAEELKDEFVSTVSHELRTPLAITKEGIALMLDGIPGEINERQRKVLTSSRGNIDRLARIINDLLDISKIEAGKMQLAKDRVDIASVAESVVRNFEPMAQQKGLQLRLHIDLRQRDVLADADRLVQVLTNLLGNALKFTQQGGVHVKLASRSDAIECIVEDSGVGMAPEDAARVFEKFTQFGRKHGAGEKGTGLGLAIAKQIVELHRGRIWVESAPGRGSRFFFSLPIYSDDELVRETVDLAILDARAQKENFTLLRFDLDPRLAPGDVARRQSYAEGFRKLKEMENLVRSSDRMVTQGGTRVVMVAKITPAQVATLYRRWKKQVATCFQSVDPTLDVHMACGYAEYPSDGSTAAEILAKAERTLSSADGVP